MTDKLVFRYLKFIKEDASTKYKDLKPKIAMMLLVKTMNSSSVIEIIAGIESKAKNKSVNSITINAKKEPVMNKMPFFL